MLLTSLPTYGLLQWVQDSLPRQADTCCTSATQGKLPWWPVAERSTPSCTRDACAAAVGTMEVSSADVARSGLKGKGLKLLHHYPDLLWALGDKSTPDSSFTIGRIFPQQVWVHQRAAPVTVGQAVWSAANCHRQTISGALQPSSTPRFSRPHMPAGCRQTQQHSRTAAVQQPLKIRQQQLLQSSWAASR